MCGYSPSGKWQRILLVMKLKIFFLLCCLGSLQAGVYSQVNQFSVQKTDVLVTEVLEELQSRSDYRFFYQKGIFGENDRVSVDFENASLQQVLDEVLVKRGFGYEIIDKVITIRRLQQQKNTKIQIKGLVTDTKKQPLPGVTVMIKGTSLGTVTDAEGHYVLTIPQRDELVLVFSFVGMNSREVTYKGEQELNVELEEKVAEMDEVVVTGIFQKSQASFTGSATTVTAKELQQFGNRNLLQSLHNIDPSINIIENNAFGSNPNKLPEVQIRGNSSIPNVDELKDQTRVDLNTPLIVLDGFETTLQKLIDINENEVETLTILKDASATAIYGSRGANGVIVITTKKPAMGQLRVSYKGDVNIEIPDLTGYDLLEAREKLELEKRVGLYSKPSNPDQGLETTALLQLFAR